MKTTNLSYAALITGLSLLISACNYSDTLMHEDVYSALEGETLQAEIEDNACGEVYTLCAGQNNTYGEIHIYNDEENIYIFCNSEEVMKEIHVWLGSDYTDAPGKRNPAPGQFPYVVEGLYDYSYTFTIPLTEIEGLENCYAVIVHVAFEDGETGYASNDCPISERYWKNWAQYVTYCLEEACAEEPEGGCETGFAYDENLATCFTDIEGVQGNRWGWVVGPLSEGSYTFPIYAGAGQCILENGEWVGNAEVTIGAGNVDVELLIEEGFELDEYHFNVSCDQVPETTAPGQYNCNDLSCSIECAEGIYVIIHTVTCN